MSNTTPTPEATPKSSPSLDSRIEELRRQALSEEQTAEQPAEQAQEPTPEPVAEQPQAEDVPAVEDEKPEPGTPYEQNGIWFVDVDLQDGSGVQTFKNKTLKGLIAELTKAQANATRKIQELNKKIKETRQLVKAEPLPELKPQELSDEDKFLIAQQFQTDPKAAIAKLSKALYGAEPEDVREAIATVKQLAADQKAAKEAAAFINAHREEYANTPANEQKMMEYLQKNGLALTKVNLEAAFDELNEAGELETLENDNPAPTKQTSKPESRTTNIQVRKRASVGVTSRQTSSVPEEEESTSNELSVEDLLKLPLDERRRRIAAMSKRGR